jgi:hypothetical protein
MQNVWRAKASRSALRKLLPLVWMAAIALADAPRGLAQQDQEQSGIESGNYNIKQSVEFGYRFTDITGNTQTYDTFVNLQQGPRLLDFTTEMTSLNHQGLLFDRLYFSNFGYGGDPNNVSRLRMSKDKWYDFNATFRRDINAWDYSLLANPLNPTSPPFANAPVGFTPIISRSPHRFETVRRMGDSNLTLLPQSRVRFRLGYSHNVTEGPSFTSYHQGTEALLLQDWKTTVNIYRLGADFKLLPRTNISYDQFWSYYKGDSGILDNHQLFALSNGTPVDIGVSLNAGANQPCGGTFTATGAVNPLCNGYLSYFQHGRARTSSPTEQISLQSGYFKKLDLSGRFSYTGGDTRVDDYNWAFVGRESRTNLRNGSLFGPVSGHRINATADLGATLHVTDKLSFLDSFHFANFHNPVVFDASSCNFFSLNLLTSASVFSTTATLPVVCASPADHVAGTPPHSGSSAPDISLAVSSLFLKQDEKTNLFEVEYQFSQRLGARLGYRYRSRTIGQADFESRTFVFFPSNQNTRTPPAPFNNLTCPVANNLPDGTCILTPPPMADASEIQIHEHAGVFGIWARPVPNWRISFDTELMSADNAFTRISPRQTQEYRIRSIYKPVGWMSLSSSAYIWEGRDNVVEINNLQHSRAYGFSATFDPYSRFSLELGYDYNDVFSQILICYVSSAAPAGIEKCPGGPGLVQELSTYTNNSHFGYFNFMVRPVKSLTARLGTNITVTNGSSIFKDLSPNAPPGTLNSRYYQPFGGLDYRFAKNWTGRAYWGFYGYHEDLSTVVQDLSVPRNFRGNLETLSVRYAF